MVVVVEMVVRIVMKREVGDDVDKGRTGTIQETIKDKCSNVSMIDKMHLEKVAILRSWHLNLR